MLRGAFRLLIHARLLKDLHCFERSVAGGHQYVVTTLSSILAHARQSGRPLNMTCHIIALSAVKQIIHKQSAASGGQYRRSSTYSTIISSERLASHSSKQSNASRACTMSPLTVSKRDPVRGIVCSGPANTPHKSEIDQSGLIETAHKSKTDHLSKILGASNLRQCEGRP